MEYKAIRLQICKTCPSLLMGVCRKCGCFVQIKTALKQQECPTGKWSKENDD